MSPTGPLARRVLRPIEVEVMEEPTRRPAPVPSGPSPKGQGSTDRLATLGRLAAMLLAAESAEEVARASLEAISRTIPVARSSVTEVDHEKRQTVVLAAVSERAGELAPGTRLGLPDEELLARYRAGERLLVQDIATVADPSRVERALAEQGVRAYVNIPLLADDEFVGSLNIGSPEPSGLTDDVLTFAEDLATLVAIAIRETRLREEVRRTSEELAAAVAELERVDAWRVGLVGMLAHDVRSPLANVISILQLVRVQADTLGPDQVSELLDGAERSARRTLRLSADLLDLARSAHGELRMDIAEVAIADAIHAALSFVREAEAVTVDVSDGLVAAVDPQRFDQIVVNLVSNALKHGEPPVTVAARSTGDELCLMVQDRGPGVTDEDRKTLFEPFAQGARADSVGLGLWVVRELVEAHGGSVGYQQVEAGGARFVLRFPGTTPGP